MSAGPAWRRTALARLETEPFDVLVVGAGATGAAVARDAALRGLRVALVDRGDFAGETSSHSSKLIHGGLRYLQYGDFGLVFEALAERRRLMTTAPHLCRPVEFLFPAYRGETPGLRKLALGVALYDALALWRPPAGSRRLSPEALQEVAPSLRTAGLAGAVAYVDCQTEDARLVLETALDAEAAGAVVATYVHVEPPAPQRSYVRTVTMRDRTTGAAFLARARAVVNATGPFADSFAAGGRALRPTLGVHLVVDAARLPTGGRAFVLRAPEDGRIVFVLPAGARTIVGTTDTDWRPPGGELRPPRAGDPVEARAEDVAYLLALIRHAFPSSDLTPADVLSTYAGLRPLIATDDHAPSATSREHEIWVDRAGVLTIAGGKLTTMRRMAEEAVDRLVDLVRARGLDVPVGPCVTAIRPLPGAQGSIDQARGALDRAGIDEQLSAHLLASYGTRAPLVLEAAAGRRELFERIAPDLPYVWAELLHGARNERALRLEDLLRRRLPLFRQAADQGLGAAVVAADLAAPLLGVSPSDLRGDVDAYREAVAASRRWRAAPWQA